MSSWLASEVDDLLSASGVGLYEFIWILRGARPDASAEEMRYWALAALKKLIDADRGRLVWLKWPSEDAIGGGIPEDLSDRAIWAAPVQDQPYLAITGPRTISLRPRLLATRDPSAARS